MRGGKKLTITYETVAIKCNNKQKTWVNERIEQREGETIDWFGAHTHSYAYLLSTQFSNRSLHHCAWIFFTLDQLLWFKYLVSFLSVYLRRISWFYVVLFHIVGYFSYSATFFSLFPFYFYFSTKKKIYWRKYQLLVERRRRRRKKTNYMDFLLMLPHFLFSIF